MQRIPVVCYLTNRPESTVKGTKRWLRKYGFPDKEVISSMNGVEWKAQKLSDMFPAQLRQLALFELFFCAFSVF